MAGYPKSVIFPASSTLPELVVWAFGGNSPALAYKAYVLGSAACLPWLIALAAGTFGLRRGARRAPSRSSCSTSGQISRSTTRRSACSPTCWRSRWRCLSLGAFAGFLTEGGAIRWLVSALLLSLAFLVHLTTAMILVPAAALAYFTALRTATRRSAENGAAPCADCPWAVTSRSGCCP